MFPFQLSFGNADTHGVTCLSGYEPDIRCLLTRILRLAIRDSRADTNVRDAGPFAAAFFCVDDTFGKNGRAATAKLLWTPWLARGHLPAPQAAPTLTPRLPNGPVEMQKLHARSAGKINWLQRTPDVLFISGHKRNTPRRHRGKSGQQVSRRGCRRQRSTW